MNDWSTIAEFLESRRDLADALTPLACTLATTDALAIDLISRLMNLGMEPAELVMGIRGMSAVVHRDREWTFAPPLKRWLLTSSKGDLKARAHRRLLQLADGTVQTDLLLPRYLRWPVATIYHSVALGSPGGAERYLDAFQGPLSAEQWLLGAAATEQQDLGVLPGEAIEPAFIFGINALRLGDLSAAAQHLLRITSSPLPRGEVAIARVLLAYCELDRDLTPAEISAIDRVRDAITEHREQGRAVAELVVERDMLRSQLQATRMVPVSGEIKIPMIDPLEPELIARSFAMRQLIARAEVCARSNTSVLVTGESGTEMELVAAWIHARSRRPGPLIRVSCAALPASLLESELFGHVKGAFTGATHDKPGALRRADGGTLFLSDIEELPLDLQVRLLRVLQDGGYEAVGSRRRLRSSVRVMTATTADLSSLVINGTFREDLYYRLATVTLEIPPLRERLEDIGPLAESFTREAARKYGVNVTRIAPPLLAELRAMRWPRNLAQLRSVLDRAVLLASPDATVLTSLAPEESSQPTLMPMAERHYLLEVLRASSGDYVVAAKRAGISLDELRIVLGEGSMETLDKK